MSFSVHVFTEFSENTNKYVFKNFDSSNEKSVHEADVLFLRIYE